MLVYPVVFRQQLHRREQKLANQGYQLVGLVLKCCEAWYSAREVWNSENSEVVKDYLVKYSSKLLQKHKRKSRRTSTDWYGTEKKKRKKKKEAAQWIRVWRVEKGLSWRVREHLGWREREQWTPWWKVMLVAERCLRGYCCAWKVKEGCGETMHAIPEQQVNMRRTTFLYDRLDHDNRKDSWNFSKEL